MSRRSVDWVVPVIVLAPALLLLGSERVEAQHPWELLGGPVCFERWIADTEAKLNAYDGSDQFNSRKPWRINEYGLFEGRLMDSLHPPDDWRQVGSSRYAWMWIHYYSEEQFPDWGPTFGGAGLYGVRWFVRNCLGPITSGDPDGGDPTGGDDGTGQTTGGGTTNGGLRTGGELQPDFLGCWTDTAARDLDGYSTSNPRMTVEMCRGICDTAPTGPFLYAALQNSAYCFCGDDYGDHGPASNCTMACAGDRTQNCGGRWANAIYPAGAFVDGIKQRRPRVGGEFLPGFIGCYKDEGAPLGTAGRDLPGRIVMENDMTVGRCVALCRTREAGGPFPYAAVQYGKACFCGTSYGAFGRAENCDMTCAGDRAQNCGGVWANAVYSTAPE